MFNIFSQSNYLRKLEYNGEIFHDQNKQDLGYSLFENL